MTKWRVTIAIVREFDNRANALSSSDSITGKIPSEWILQTESCEKV